MTATGVEPRTIWLIMDTQPFSQTGQVIELCSEYLSVRCFSLYVLVMSLAPFADSVPVTYASNFTPALSNGFLDIHATIESGFTQHTFKYTVQISTQNTAQSFGQFG